MIELDPNAMELKSRTGKNKQHVDSKHENSMVGGKAVAARQYRRAQMTLLAWNYRGLGSNLAIRILTDEVKATDLTLVFLAETKASVNWIKAVQRKLEFSQGIIVPSDERSGGLALLWKEGTMIDFKSCSNSHIDLVVRESSSSKPW